VRLDRVVGGSRKLEAVRELVRGAAKAVQEIEHRIAVGSRDRRRQVDDRDPVSSGNGRIRDPPAPHRPSGRALVDQLERRRQRHLLEAGNRRIGRRARRRGDQGEHGGECQRSPS